MSPALRDCLRKELDARGFSPSGESPNGTMTLDDLFLADVDLGGLFDTMVARREKVFSSEPVVGEDVARKSFQDVVLAIDALKAVIGRLVVEWRGPDRS